MILFFAAALIALKLKGYKPSVIFKMPAFYPLFACEVVYWFFQINAVFGNYYFVRFAPYLQFAFTGVLIFPIMAYRLYKPAIVGAALTVVGSALNRLCISANGGFMPVYPTLSRLTGYFRPDAMDGSVDSLHILMTEDAALKFLADYIDIGWSVMSIGDILIHSFCAIIIFYAVKAASGAIATPDTTTVADATVSSDTDE